MKKSVIISEKEHFLIADIVAIEDWNGFESIAKYLEKYHSALLVSKVDGPESRIWEFEINGRHLSLHNNPYGNYFKLLNSNDGYSMLQVIADDLNKRLANSND